MIPQAEIKKEMRLDQEIELYKAIFKLHKKKYAQPFLFTCALKKNKVQREDIVRLALNRNYEFQSSVKTP